MNQSEETLQNIPSDVKQWAMGCHLIALVGLLGNGIGFFLGPLVFWLIKREAHPFINEQGKEAVNFQLTMLIAFIVSGILVIVLIGFFLLIICMIYTVVMTIIAGIQASKGEHYRYPICIRFIK